MGKWAGKGICNPGNKLVWLLLFLESRFILVTVELILLDHACFEPRFEFIMWIKLERKGSELISEQVTNKSIEIETKQHLTVVPPEGRGHPIGSSHPGQWLFLETQLQGRKQRKGCSWVICKTLLTSTALKLSRSTVPRGLQKWGIWLCNWNVSMN